jgi:hypothetical protein
MRAGGHRQADPLLDEMKGLRQAQLDMLVVELVEGVKFPEQFWQTFALKQKTQFLMLQGIQVLLYKVKLAIHLVQPELLQSMQAPFLNMRIENPMEKPKTLQLTHVLLIKPYPTIHAEHVDPS